MSTIEGRPIQTAVPRKRDMTAIGLAVLVGLTGGAAIMLLSLTALLWALGGIIVIASMVFGVPDA